MANNQIKGEIENNIKLEAYYKKGYLQAKILGETELWRDRPY